MATPAAWLAGSRPRTLPAAIAPVAAGTGLAAEMSSLMPVRSALCLVVAVALRVGVNYANDYSDGVRGTDDARVGPVRLVGQGLASPVAVRRAAWASFTLAAVAGLVLIVMSAQWWLILVGAASIAAAWFYTGGPRPYGYLGLGEIFVFVFFGLVPVVGTCYVQTLTITVSGVCVGACIGALACAILVANNLRDIPTDADSGKRTLAVRLGDGRTRALYVGLVSGSVVLLLVTAALTTKWALATLLCYVLAVRPVRTVLSGARGPALIAVLKDTGLLLLAVGLTLGLLLALG